MGLVHGINDCVAGFVLGSFAINTNNTADVSWWILLYNVLAFGGQAPLAMLADRFNYNKAYIFAATLCNAIGLLLFMQIPMLAVVFLGLGSAIIHIAGGTIALLANPQQAGTLGLFTAPGVLGLAFGGLMAFLNVNISWVLLLGTFLSAVIAFCLPSRPKQMVPKLSEQGALLDKHDWVMMLLLLVIAMRSAIWNTFQLIHQGDYHLLLYLAVAAMGGKLFGGFAADKIGWKNYALAALLLAAPLLTLGGRKPVLLALGIGLLQSVTPLALAAMGRSLPHRPALATGLTLGLAIALGGVPMFFGLNWFREPTALLLLLPLLALAYFVLLNLQEAKLKRISINAQPMQKREQPSS